MSQKAGGCKAMVWSNSMCSALALCLKLAAIIEPPASFSLSVSLQEGMKMMER